MIFPLLLLQQGLADSQEVCLCKSLVTQKCFLKHPQTPLMHSSVWKRLLTKPWKLGCLSLYVCMCVWVYVQVKSCMCNCTCVYVQLYVGLCVWCLGVIDTGEDCCLITIPYLCEWNYIKLYPRNTPLFLNFHSGKF